MQDFELEFVDDEITSYGGLSLLKKMIDKMGFLDQLEHLPLPAQGSKRGYAPTQLFIQFIASLWCGASRFSHLDITRFDRCIQQLFCWRKMAEHKSFQRYFQKFDIPTSHSVFGGLYSWFFKNMKFDNYTLDVDSSVITRYGEQQGSKKGYNKHKPGRKSQHPIIAFVAEVEMVANFWLRPGDAHTANNFKAFLEETLSYLGEKKIQLLRLDSGFYDKNIFNYLEQEKGTIDYVVAVPMYVTIQRALRSQGNWVKVEDGIEITEFEYKGTDWSQPRRMIAVRQKIAERPNAVGKQLSLFEDDIEISGYRYTCYITTLKQSPIEVWRLYRGRANCENRIKELKYDYGMDKMNQDDFDGTETCLLLMTIAYNLLSVFKQNIIKEEVRNRLATLRHKILAIPAYIVSRGEKQIIKMAAHISKRAWIRKIWETSESFEFG